MLYLLIAMAFILSYVLFLIVLIIIYNSRLNIQERLNYIEGMYRGSIDLQDRRKLPFKERIIIPAIEKVRTTIYKMTPKGMMEEIDRKLKTAGYPFSLGPMGWLGLQIAFYILFPGLLLIILWNSLAPITSKALLFIIFTIVCLLFPNTILRERAKGRKNRLVLQLPDVLDLLTVSVEAGLSFDGAIAWVVEKAKGELVQEFNTVLNEIAMGKTRREALIAMSRRCDTPDITTFISTITQAEQMGVSIGRILRVQGDQVRDKRRQRARELAMKTPVKMLIPMLLFIFPTIFLVILGPAMIQILNTFTF